MRDLFLEMVDLVENDPGTINEHLGKLAEETGELAKVLNTITGRRRRRPGENDSALRDQAKGELADVINVVFAIAAKMGITYEELEEKLAVGNAGYADFVNKHYILKRQ